MVDDPNRKSLRQFSCRDHLWESFEQLSLDLECSVDYLINEAMRQYLRSQGHPSPSKGVAEMGDGRPGPMMRPAQANTPIPPLPAMPAASQGMGGPPALPPLPGASNMRSSIPAAPPVRGSAPQMPVFGGLPQMPSPRAPAPLPALPSQPARATAPPPVMRSSTPMGQPAGVGLGPPPMQPMRQPPPAPMAQPGQRMLYAVYADQQVPVTKEEFWIGRGQKTCDLVIRDTNISRQHARVVLHNGQYWMLDNESTNGVEFRGAKIQQKRVDDGDVFTICGHDVHFVYR